MPGSSPATTADGGHETPRGTRDLASAGGQACGRWTEFDWQATSQAIPQRVSALASRHPDRVAVFDVGTELTCGALDLAANRVANALLAARGAGSEPVLLLFDVGAAAIVAALGVAKAGKYFIGVEPSFPKARIDEIADDAGAATMLTNVTHLPLARDVAGSKRAIIDLDALGTNDEEPPRVDVDLDSAALLNYTSGSTGKPKGVVHTHRSAIAQACRYGNSFRLGDADRLASFGSLAWAGSFWDAFGSLCLGAGVGLYDVRRYGVHRLASWLEQNRLTVLSGTTVARRLAFDLPQTRLPDVRLVQLGGDTIYRRDIDACRRVFPNAVMAVGLGTSEAGRIAEQYLAPGIPVEHEVVPVGFATPGVRILLVGEDGAEVPPETVGEIIAQSDELARGYWNLPALTAEKFRREPRFGTSTCYFTGDLGRLLPDGSLQHVGRKDFQLKVHGYPVAANEVEALLLGMEGVREACVTVQPSAAGDEHLVAFLVRAGTATVPAGTLRDRLAEQLPDYMVPRRFVDLDALPKTSTGKIDRRALPAAPVSRRDLGTAFVAPRSPLEADLAAIWAEVLGIDAVSIDDDFLALGGDSLGATRIANRVMRDFGIDLPLGTLLASPTVAEMAALIASARPCGRAGVAAPGIVPRGR